MGRKFGSSAPFGGGGAGSPTSTIYIIGPSCMPSGIYLIHIAVWPVEPAALHAAAKNIIYFTALAVLRGAPAFCVALRRHAAVDR